MSQMKKRLDEINTVVETYLRPIEQETGDRRVCLESIDERMRILLIQHGNLQQALNPLLFK